MKIIKTILIVIISLTAIIVLMLFNYGWFTNVGVQLKEEGGEKLVYESRMGSYDKSGDVIHKLENQLKNENIKAVKGFGWYLDNPRFVKKDSLRSEVGCMLESVDTSKISGLKGKYNIKTCPVKKYITAEFPYKSNVSIILGVLKVYPAMMKFVKDNNYDEKGAIMEIYDISNNRILYRKEAVKIEK